MSAFLLVAILFIPIMILSFHVMIPLIMILSFHVVIPSFPQIIPSLSKTGSTPPLLSHKQQLH